MTSEERDARLTAYALNDPGVTPAERYQIEAIVAGDPAARQAVEETRQLAHVLNESLAAEQAATPATAAVKIPATSPVKRKVPAWTLHVVAASFALFAVAGLTYLIWNKSERIKANRYDPVAARSATTGAPFGDRGNVALGYADNAPLESADLDKKILRDEDRSSGATSRLKSPSPLPPGPVTIINSASASGGAATGAGVPKPDSGGGRPGLPGPGQPGKYFDPTAPLDGKGLPDLTLTESLKAAQDAAYGRTGLHDDTNKGDPDSRDPIAANDRYPQLRENSFIKVEGLNALSTFGVDVDTASYAIVRKYLTMGQLPPANAVRLEEMVNYFPYSDKAPDGADPFAVTVEMADCPWQPAHRLVRLGLKAKPIANDKRPPSNLVFLIDVSGSMDAPNRLPLVKESLKLLVNQLGENDRVAMVVYAGASGLVLDSTSAMKKETILNALDQLSAGGSTHGSSGIQLAYDVAVKHFIKNGTNRVILCTDGDWNVGTTSTDALVKLIEQKRETGVFLSVFGFGMGNLRDEMMVKLAGKGNGNYGYIDTIKEAHKSFVEQLGGTLVTVAKDVKIQIEFNPAAIKSYRLLGYEKRLLAAKDFHDDKKDAGEMGAGHVVTALYELVPVGVADPIAGKVDGLRYQKEPEVAKPAVKSDKVHEAFVVKMRHKKPDGDTSTLREMPVSNISKEYGNASEDFQFSAAVASFAMTLRNSPFKGNSSYSLVLELTESAKKREPGAFGEYRAEFVELVKKAKSLSGK